MSPSDFLLAGCLCGALGFVGALALLFGQDWIIRRGAQRWRNDMEGE